MGDYVLDGLKAIESRMTSIEMKIESMSLPRITAKERDDLCEKFNVNECVFDFGTAIRLMKMGRKVRRKSWYPGAVYVATNRENTVFFKYYPAASLDKVEFWIENHEDLLAEDWKIVK